LNFVADSPKSQTGRRRYHRFRGRGLGKPENFQLIRELASALGAAVGSSRPLCGRRLDSLFASGRAERVKTVCPKLNIAVGISGAVQHMAGMQTSDCIVAINDDPEAPIFSDCYLRHCRRPLQNRAFADRATKRTVDRVIASEARQSQGGEMNLLTTGNSKLITSCPFSPR